MLKEDGTMGFIRARGEEQKKIRIQQIVDAAASLYAEVGYDKVTFSQIGRKLSFSRLNLYNYFHCKEDIFLTLLLQDIGEMVEDAGKTFSGMVTDRDAFCLAWAELMKCTNSFAWRCARHPANLSRWHRNFFRSLPRSRPSCLWIA